MTANELKRIALRLSKQSWCRHWLHFNYPSKPAQMAIQCLSANMSAGLAKVTFDPVETNCLLELGFKADDFHKNLYLIDRTNEDGTPFVSQL